MDIREALAFAKQCAQFAKEANVPFNLNFNLNFPFSLFSASDFSTMITPSVNPTSDVGSSSSPAAVVSPKPTPSYTPPFPREGDYNAVREYVEERKKYDSVFLQYCKTHNRTQLCNRLTEEFGWEVKVDSYGKNVNRNL